MKMTKTTRIFSIATLQLERERKRRRSRCWMTIEENKAGTLLCLRLSAPPRIPLWATRHYLHSYLNCSVVMKITKSKKSMLAFIAINQMGTRSHALSSRQRVPPSVCPSANEVRAPLHVRKSRVKRGVTAFGRRPWVGARPGRRQRDDRLRRRVDVERRCAWGAVEWTVCTGHRPWETE